MQENTTAADQDLGQAARASSKKWNWGYGCLGVIIACVVLYFAVRFFGGYMPVSTLRVKELPTWASLLEACGNSTDKWTIRYETPIAQISRLFS